MKNSLSPHVELANQIVEQCRLGGIVHNVINNRETDGKNVILNGKRVTYFGNCSYLGLGQDDRLKDAAIDAIHRYGIQFACSRAYASVPLIEEAESLLTQIFGKPTIAAQTTTLAHLSTVPVLMRREDAIIIDHQAHTSMHNAVAIAKSMGVHVEMIRHNRMDMLESRLKKMAQQYDRIWFMADGVYSMFGDVAPLSTLWNLMNQYDNFFCYIDDAHGMSWAGKHGSGYALSQLPSFHDKMVLVTSLNKGFGAYGAAIVLPNEEWRRVILNVGPTLMFSGPLSPSTLGVIIASAKIHLTPEITEKQERLSQLMSYFTLTAKSLSLPLANEDHAPIFFVGVGGTLEAGLEISKRMIKSGHLLNLSSFPAVPYKNTGLRVTLTTTHTEQDIFEMLYALSEHLSNVESQAKVSRKEIHTGFGMSLQNN